MIIGHLGDPTLADLEQGQRYWEGMRRLAELEPTTIKLSMLTYQDPEWDSNQLVKGRSIIAFGIDRCFAEFSVEQHLGWSASRLYRHS